MPFFLRLVLALVILAAPLGAQAAPSRDSVLAVRIRADCVATERDKSAPLYSRQAIARCKARADSITALHKSAVVPVPPPPPPAPSASFVVVCAQLQCAFNAGASTGARLSFAWDCGALPNCAATSSAFSFGYPHEGSRTATLTVRDSLGRTATAARTFTVPGVPVPVDTVVAPRPPPVVVPPVVVPPVDTGVVIAVAPELPRSTPSAAVPAPTGVKIPVPNGWDLQKAINSAKPGDVVALAPGATFTGGFVLPAKACTGWVTLRTDTTDAALPATDVRMTPTAAARARLAKLVSPDNQPALRTALPTCQWRVFAIEVTGTLPASSVQYGLVTLGADGDGGQTSIDKVPTDLVLDRVYIHGTPTLNVVRCLALNSARTSVVNSWLGECHAKGFDSQAIEGWNGPGPYLIENNRVDGAGENIMFGGADPAIAGLSPSDITIRRNHVYKDPSWKGVWTVKNLFELKNSRRTLVEGNVFENNWADAQSGMAIVVKSTTDACGLGCLWEGSTDFTFRYNLVRNSPRGFNAQAFDNSYSERGSDVHVARVRAEHNLFENIGTFNGTGSDGWLVLLTHDLTDVALVHNTFVGNLAGAGTALYTDYGNGAARRVVLDDNVFAARGYIAMATSGASHTAALRALAGTSWSFQRNAVAQVWAEYWPQNPSTSWYRATVAELGLAADYSLLPTSPFKGKGWNGTDPGADIPELTRRTAGVVVAP